MSYIKAILKKVLSVMLIPYDKALHFIAGFILFILFSLFLGSITSLIIVCLFAIGKEYYDYKTYGKFDLADMVITIIPAMIMVAYLEIVSLP